MSSYLAEQFGIIPIATGALLLAQKVKMVKKQYNFILRYLSLNFSCDQLVKTIGLYYVSIIPDRNRSVSIFISDRPFFSIGADFFRHDFRKGEGLERSDSESDTRRIG